MKYYMHDTSSFEDEKITMLYIQFGYEGLGLFYTILEKIAKHEKPVSTVVLKKQLNVGKKLEKCWSFLESLDLISTKNGETFNKRLIKFSENIGEKREKTSKRVSQFRDKQEVAKDVTRYNDDSNAPNLNYNLNNNINYSNTNVLPDEPVDSSVIEIVAEVVSEEPAGKPRKPRPSRKKNPEDYSIVTKMKLIVFELNKFYRWNGLDGKAAKSISEGIVAVGKVNKNGEEPTEEEVLKYFRAMLNPKYHPPFFKGNWDLKKINSEFVAITSNMQKPGGANGVGKTQKAMNNSDIATQMILDEMKRNGHE